MTQISKAERRRRRIFATLVDEGLLPGPLPPERIYATSGLGLMKYAALPGGIKLPLRSAQKFKALPERSKLLNGPSR